MDIVAENDLTWFATGQLANYSMGSHAMHILKGLVCKNDKCKPHIHAGKYIHAQVS